MSTRVECKFTITKFMSTACPDRAVSKTGPALVLMDLGRAEVVLINLVARDELQAKESC